MVAHPRLVPLLCSVWRATPSYKLISPPDPLIWRDRYNCSKPLARRAGGVFLGLLRRQQRSPSVANSRKLRFLLWWSCAQRWAGLTAQAPATAEPSRPIDELHTLPLLPLIHMDKDLLRRQFLHAPFKPDVLILTKHGRWLNAPSKKVANQTFPVDDAFGARSASAAGLQHIYGSAVDLVFLLRSQTSFNLIITI